MAGALKAAALTTRNARTKLAEQARPHWFPIDADTHLGYRKGKRAGVWVVRWAIGKGAYKQASVGTADDEISVGTLNFDQAKREAVKIVEGIRRDEAAEAAGPIKTVSSACEAYMRMSDDRDSSRSGRAVKSVARSTLTLYVMGSSIAPIALHKLTATNLANWRKGLTGKATSQQRIVNDLRAALNEADSEKTFSSVFKVGLKAPKIEQDDEVEVARENQILTDAQIILINAAAQEVDAADGWDGDLFRIVLLIAATGARFSQVARLRVGDLQPDGDKPRIMMPRSRKGKGKTGKQALPIGRDVVTALLPAYTRRPSDAPLLERWRSKQALGKVTTWERDARGPWTTSSEITRPWNKIRKAAGVEHVVPYSLRHSSIVKGIRQNLPVRLVAAMHDTSIAMIERHYSKWIVDGLDDIVRNAIVPMVPTGESNVVRIA